MCSTSVCGPERPGLLLLRASGARSGEWWASKAVPSYLLTLLGVNQPLLSATVLSRQGISSILRKIRQVQTLSILFLNTHTHTHSVYTVTLIPPLLKNKWKMRLVPFSVSFSSQNSHKRIDVLTVVLCAQRIKVKVNLGNQA